MCGFHQILTTSTPARNPSAARGARGSPGHSTGEEACPRPKLVLVLFAALVVSATAAGFAVAGMGNGNDKTFQYAIGLWGDMPYSDTQATKGVPNLLDDMNGQDISFSVHDGDLKAGNATPGSATPTTCQNAVQPSIYSQGLAFFNSLDKPAIFTPGDNDWTDCDRTSNGGFNSLERLQYERGVFFASDTSLGRHPMQLEVQTEPLCQGTTSLTGQPRFMTGCVENRRWTFHDVTYATLNVQGSCNNLCSSGAGDPGGDVPSTPRANRPTSNGCTRRSRWRRGAGRPPS
jgi:hypothetical protein